MLNRIVIPMTDNLVEALDWAGEHTDFHPVYRLLINAIVTQTNAKSVIVAVGRADETWEATVDGVEYIYHVGSDDDAFVFVLRSEDPFSQENS